MENNEVLNQTFKSLMSKMSNEISFSSLQMKAMLACDKAAFPAPLRSRSLNLKVRQGMDATWVCACAPWGAETHSTETEQQLNLFFWWWRGIVVTGQK